MTGHKNRCLNSNCLILCVLVVIVMIYLFCEIFNWRGHSWVKHSFAFFTFIGTLLCENKQHFLICSLVLFSLWLCMFLHTWELNWKRYIFTSLQLVYMQLLQCLAPQQTHQPHSVLTSLFSSVQFRLVHFGLAQKKKKTPFNGKKLWIGPGS